MLFFISWKMTLFTLAVMVPGLVFMPIYGKFVAKIAKNITNGNAEANIIAEESFSNIRTVKSFATEDF